MMAYQIQYEPEKNRKYPAHFRRRKSLVIPILIAVAIVVCFAICGKTGILIPGDPQVTAQAFSQMVDMVRNGEQVEDALSTFCVEVLEHGTQDTD